MNAAGRPVGLASHLPGLAVLIRYERSWAIHDVAAGLILATMLVPVGVAYAVASGLPGVCGLYATIVPLLAYAVFGPSRILVIGPDSALAALILSVVMVQSAGAPARAMALGAALALVSGLICVSAGLLRLGFVTELLSKPIRYGYMNGIALTVIISQIPGLLGFSIDGRGPLRDIAAVGSGILDGEVNIAGLLVGVGTLVAILLLRPYRRVPGILVAVALAALAVGGLGLAERFGVAVLGSLPRGPPHFVVPIVAWEDAGTLLLAGSAIALVSFADTSVLSRVYAARAGARVDPNQEMVALGAANLAAGFFQGFPISSSSSRTPVAEAAGARTQLACVVAAVGVLLLLLAAPNLLASLPKAALAAVVIASAFGLFEIRDLLRIHRAQRWEFWLSIACFAGVATLGAIPGIGIAVVLAVIEFLWDGWRPYSAILGRAPGVEGYHDVSRYPDAERLPGMVLFRWDAPLFFANAELFHDRVLAAVAASPTPVATIVVAAEPVTSIDATSADVVAALHDVLLGRGTELVFAGLKDPVKEKFRRHGLTVRIGEDRFFPTLDSAIRRFGPPGDEGTDASVAAGGGARAPTMAVEIERKFLVVGDGWRVTPGELYRQGYICGGDVTVRVRCTPGGWRLTIKGPRTGFSRLEFECDVPAPDGEALLGLCARPLIEKVRHQVRVGDTMWVVDEFGGEHAGLILAEVELGSEDQRVELPDWIGAEVTLDPRYHNSNLGRAPLPPPLPRRRPPRSTDGSR